MPGMKFPVVPLAAVLLGGLCSCTAPAPTGPGITRVKTYRLDPSEPPATAEQAITFEHKHYLHGAVSDAEREARRGNYYTFFFNPPNSSLPVTARYEYRQQTTGFNVHVKTQQVPGEQGLVRFNVSGAEFQERGQLLGWRVTLSQAGKVFGQRQSFLWD